jgi:hypothetical protein
VLFNEAPPLKEDGAFFLVLLARLLFVTGW